MKILKAPAPKLPLVSKMESQANRAYKTTLSATVKADKEKAQQELAAIKAEATKKLAWYESISTFRTPSHEETVTKNKQRLHALLEDLNQVVK